MPKYAICLAAFNGVRWLPEQLDSILVQEGCDITVFISVDMSTDGTEEWVNARSYADKRIVILPHNEYFGGAARNFFRLLRDVDFSGFDYVGFADQDDIWLPGKLLHAHEVMLQSGSDAYSSNVIAFWTNGRKILIKKSQSQRRWDFLFEAAGPGCTYVMKIKLANAIQKFVRESGVEMKDVGLHDWFSYAFARAQGYRWVIDDYVGMLYRQHDENQIGVNYGWNAFKHRVNKVLSGWGLAQSILIARLVGLGQASFVTHWASSKRWGFLWLALHANQCRRRFRDRIFFALSCLILFLVGFKNK